MSNPPTPNQREAARLRLAANRLLRQADLMEDRGAPGPEITRKLQEARRLTAQARAVEAQAW